MDTDTEKEIIKNHHIPVAVMNGHSIRRWRGMKRKDVKVWVTRYDGRVNCPRLAVSTGYENKLYTSEYFPINFLENWFSKWESWYGSLRDRIIYHEPIQLDDVIQICMFVPDLMARQPDAIRWFVNRCMQTGDSEELIKAKVLFSLFKAPYGEKNLRTQNFRVCSLWNKNWCIKEIPAPCQSFFVIGNEFPIVWDSMLKGSIGNVYFPLSSRHCLCYIEEHSYANMQHWITATRSYISHTQNYYITAYPVDVDYINNLVLSFNKTVYSCKSIV